MVDVNFYAQDHALKDAVNRSDAANYTEAVIQFGSVCGSQQTRQLADLANATKPQLKAFDRYGHRINEVDYHPAYHQLMDMALGNQVSSIAWTAKQGGHTAHSALMYLLAQAEPGICCPISMTYAGVAALRHQPDIVQIWEPLLTAGHYDQSVQPITSKTAATLGMAMTEKQGGSDVKANTTQAVSIGSGGPGTEYELTGHKWFCSAPMSDGFLTLAQTPDGLSCFLVPRWRPDATRNSMHIMRLKDKLGDHANASSEIEYHGAYAQMVGEEGKGIQTIIDMVHHTRLDCTIAPAAYMRKTLSLAIWHCRYRQVFGKSLIEQPLMQQVLADLALESEAATVLAFRVAHSFDRAAEDEHEALLSRIITPIAKYWLNKRVTGFVHEAMECHGGNGYIEEFELARYYRQAPLNGIWEGSGNIMCLDVLRAMMREPRTVQALIDELDRWSAGETQLKKACAEIKHALFDKNVTVENVRYWVEQIALCLQLGLLRNNSPNFIGDAFMRSRLQFRGGYCYGSHSAAFGKVEQILQRALSG